MTTNLRNWKGGIFGNDVNDFKEHLIEVLNENETHGIKPSDIELLINKNGLGDAILEALKNTNTIQNSAEIKGADPTNSFVEKAKTWLKENRTHPFVATFNNTFKASNLTYDEFLGALGLGQSPMSDQNRQGQNRKGDRKQQQQDDAKESQNLGGNEDSQGLGGDEENQNLGNDEEKKNDAQKGDDGNADDDDDDGKESAPSEPVVEPEIILPEPTGDNHAAVAAAHAAETERLRAEQEANAKATAEATAKAERDRLEADKKRAEQESKDAADAIAAAAIADKAAAEAKARAKDIEAKTAGMAAEAAKLRHAKAELENTQAAAKYEMKKLIAEAKNAIVASKPHFIQMSEFAKSVVQPQDKNVDSIAITTIADAKCQGPFVHVKSEIEDLKNHPEIHGLSDSAVSTVHKWMKQCKKDRGLIADFMGSEIKKRVDSMGVQRGDLVAKFDTLKDDLLKPPVGWDIKCERGILIDVLQYPMDELTLPEKDLTNVCNAIVKASRKKVAITNETFQYAFEYVNVKHRGKNALKGQLIRCKSRALYHNLVNDGCLEKQARNPELYAKLVEAMQNASIGYDIVQMGAHSSRLGADLAVFVPSDKKTDRPFPVESGLRSGVEKSDLWIQDNKFAREKPISFLERQMEKKNQTVSGQFMALVTTFFNSHLVASLYHTVYTTMMERLRQKGVFRLTNNNIPMKQDRAMAFYMMDTAYAIRGAQFHEKLDDSCRLTAKFLDACTTVAQSICEIEGLDYNSGLVLYVNGMKTINKKRLLQIALFYCDIEKFITQFLIDFSPEWKEHVGENFTFDSVMKLIVQIAPELR